MVDILGRRRKWRTVLEFHPTGGHERRPPLSYASLGISADGWRDRPTIRADAYR